jgi:nicotinamide-nucleotide amidase
MRRAMLIAVGSELLRFGRVDTNTQWLSARLNAAGIEVAARSMVEDDAGAIAALLRSAREQAPLVLVTGGIGPTDDDRTREGVARALGLELERDRARVSLLRAAFEARGYRFRDVQARQADRPRGAEWIPNPLGTAPGFLLAEDRRLLAVLPGVPAEMRAMFEASVLPRLAPGAPLAYRVLRIGGRTESSVEEQVQDLYGRDGVDVTILSGGDGIELHLRAHPGAGGEPGPRVDRLLAEMERRLGADLYSVDGGSLAGVVGSRLAEHGRTVATAESCTGGMLGAALTAEPGASTWYRGGVVSYSDDLKQDWLDVEPEALARHGAVSPEVACAMAEGIRRRSRSDYGVGITGIAGPGGGTAEKPVGLVHLGLADREATVHRELRLIGDRGLIRRRTVNAALDLLRRRIDGTLAP